MDNVTQHIPATQTMGEETDNTYYNNQRIYTICGQIQTSTPRKKVIFLASFVAFTVLCNVGTGAYFTDHQKNSAKESTYFQLLPVLDYTVNMTNLCNEDYVFENGTLMLSCNYISNELFFNVTLIFESSPSSAMLDFQCKNISFNAKCKSGYLHCQIWNGYYKTGLNN